MPEYTRNPPLEPGDLAADPAEQLQRWLQDARAAGMREPTAMTLATATVDGRPSARIMLFKGFDDGGLTFYTSYGSRKGREIQANPLVALAFWWDRLERQVRVEGRAERLPRSVSEAYFRTRPRDSQLGACTSRQSQPVASREELETRLAENARRFDGREVSMPEDWGGYRMVPELYEFWQGQPARFHDRFEYRRADGAWVVQRLQP